MPEEKEREYPDTSDASTIETRRKEANYQGVYTSTQKEIYNQILQFRKVGMPAEENLLLQYTAIKYQS